MSVLPPPPSLPTQADQARAEAQAASEQIVTHQHDELVRDYFARHVGDQRLAVWGPPDISLNTLADIATQLTTPGLYGLGPPDLRHPTPEGQRLADWLQSQGYWSRLQYVQYLAIGVGDALLRLDVDAQGRLTCRPVSPSRVYVRCEIDDPSRAVELWELRLRRHSVHGEIWCYDVYDLEGPSLRICRATPEGLGEDLTPYYLGEAVDAPYAYVYPDGAPFIPYSHHYPLDTGEYWHAYLQRGAKRGALNAMLYHTYAGYCARDATGSTTIMIGARIPSTQQDLGLSGEVSTIQTMPGTIIMATQDPDANGQPLITTIGPAANLPALQDFAREYVQAQAVQFGLSANATRTGDNNVSGVALFLSNQDKREQAARVTPTFRRCDLDAVGKIAALYTRAGLGSAPVDGYTITYRTIPHSADEVSAQLAEEEALQAAGQISAIEIYQRRHPGASRDDAIRALVQVRRDDSLLRRLADADATRADDAADELEAALEDLTDGDVEAALDGLRATLTILRPPVP